MFNLTIPQTLGLDAGSTPKTPEIVNSLIAMSNPMDNYNFSSSSSAAQGISVRSFNSLNPQAISQDSSHSSCSGSPLDSPAGTATTPSVQQTCSQLIKAGLKLSIQSKRKLSTCESSSGSEQTTSKCSRKDDDTSDEDCDNKSIKGLTPEDEDRRRRRRERNKIAATKCRMKKRERTANLMKESEQLDTQNIDLKNQVRSLELERQQLFDMLQAHSPSCVRRGGFNPPTKLLQSPAFKYLADLELDIKPFQQTSSDLPVPVTSSETSKPTQSQQQQQQQQQRTIIPPMSTINNRSNVFKATTAAIPNSPQHHHQQTSNSTTHHTSDIIPNGYCKPSPTAQELGYLNSPAQDVCLPQMQTQTQSHLLHHNNHQQHLHQHQHLQHHPVISQSLISDYIPNCDSSLTSTSDTTSDFVKNELVDSQSPYTTAQSAERFLFESDSFDLKHNSNTCNNNNTSNHNANIVDFHGPMGCTTTIVPFHDHISIKNDLLSVQEADFLSHLTGDTTDPEFVDLDTGVAAAFSQMANGGCLA